MSFLTLITPPSVEPLIVGDVRQHSRISHTVEDNLLAAWIKTGRELAEGYLRQSLITQTWQVSYDCLPATPILLPRPPTTSVRTITFYDYLGVANELYDAVNLDGSMQSDFIIQTGTTPARIDLAHAKDWPSTPARSIGCLEIVYTCGYGADGSFVPASVRDAIMLYCAYRYENRAAESGAVPEQFYNLLRFDRVYI